MKDSRKGKGDGEKGLWMPSPHVDYEKGKKAIVYKAKKKRRKVTEKKEIRSLGHVRRDLLLNSTLMSLTFLH